ncbi:MAG: hypothetical protein M0C28_01755 [Candidatus Moduliflexus flocculans]|nr:hypothetical protein [Candidatus Moduliflexus flocculans]
MKDVGRVVVQHLAHRPDHRPHLRLPAEHAHRPGRRRGPDPGHRRGAISRAGGASPSAASRSRPSALIVAVMVFKKVLGDLGRARAVVRAIPPTGPVGLRPGCSRRRSSSGC